MQRRPLIYSAIILCLCIAYAHAQTRPSSVSLTIYHRGSVPKDVQKFRAPGVSVRLKDLRDLEQIEQRISDAIIGSHSIDPKRLDILQQRIASLDTNLLQQLKAASADHIKARDAGIKDDSRLPAVMLEFEGQRWVYYGNSLGEAYTLWLARE